VAVSDNWVVEDPKKKVNWFDLFNPRHLKIIETNAFQDYENFFESKSHVNYMCNHPTKGNLRFLVLYSIVLYFLSAAVINGPL